MRQHAQEHTNPDAATKLETVKRWVAGKVNRGFITLITFNFLKYA